MRPGYYYLIDKSRRLCLLQKSSRHSLRKTDGGYALRSLIVYCKNQADIHYEKQMVVTHYAV